MRTNYDVIIVGSGAGGATLAYALRRSGLQTLVIERGGFLPKEPQNSDPAAVFGERRYQARETWATADGGLPVIPTEYHVVGGKTKVYGAALLRFRERDFEALRHREGLSPQWPITYAELEPYYVQAEKLYRVHGVPGADPTEPFRSAPFPYPALPQDDYIRRLAARLSAQGLRPFPIPMGLDYRDGGRCIYCRTCDQYPCPFDAKCDAEVCCLRPALETGRVELLVNALVRRLLVGPDGRVDAVEVEREGTTTLYRARLFVVSGGAVASAALLLRSRCASHPRGLANSSGLLGANLMVHNCTGMAAFHFLRRNTAAFQKTLGITDYYLGGPGWPHPMGSIQLLGFCALEHDGVPVLGRWLSARSIQLFAMSEDLPDPENRVLSGDDGRIQVRYRANNMATHERLVTLTRRLFRRAGYSLVVARRTYESGHVCGTARFGSDPRTSVLDPYCRAHDIANLYVVDGSFFPSSAAVNPALTIIAQALRVGEHIARSYGNGGAVEPGA